MTKVFLFVVIVFTSFQQSWADSYGFFNPYSKANSLALVKETCEQKMVFISEEDLCKDLAPYLKVKQVSACADFSPFSDDRMVCLKAASTGTSSQQIKVCAQETFSSGKQNCLLSGGSASVLQQCNKSLTFMSEKDLCKDLATHLSVKKVIMCSQFSAFASDRESCLHAAANGASAYDIMICSQETFSSEKVECLSDLE